MKKAIVLAAALILCGSAFAQETNRDANGNIQYGSYETNKFFDNWFIGVGGGVDFVVDNVKGGNFPGSGDVTPALDVVLGKWIDPCFGVRLGYEGLKASNNDTKFGYNQIHGDFLWNISNQFWGYKEKRVYNAIPYLHAGLLFDKNCGKEFGVGAGWLNNFRLGEKVNLFLDLRATAAHAEQFNASSPVAGLLSASLGLTYGLGRATWTRTATTAAAAAAALAAAEAAKNAAQADADKAAADAANALKNAQALADENEALKDELAKAKANQGVAAIDLAETPIIAYFEIGKTTLSAKELAHLEYNVKTAIAQNKDIALTISGNADSKTGTKKRNQYLSQKRADYLFDLLVNKYGLDGSNFTVKANGGNDIFSTPALNRAGIISK